ncbi:N-acetylneuraminate synthase [Leptospira perdikensis]|uniref:N-acetylneuraminate synthase n=1 Tax=Leptospira perdikensis TaxID=2484948 RepID=A0A4R9JK32_9LEPT|nr:N-acetylneuraminate synthase [Leptospira perdikensis]TGL45830.1 N-acetylneuraminate synthase [Leptospira perdikensis]
MNTKTTIIAEAGVNHNGVIEKAFQLIDVASEAGADYVKFQTFNSEKLSSKIAKKAAYQKVTTDSEESQLDMLKKLELSKEAHYKLIDYAKQKKIKFLSTAFDLESLDFLKTLDLDLFKIPSGEITNYPYLKMISTFKKEIILSTGMANLSDIEQALDVLTSNGLVRSDITVLHCNTEYPTPFEDVNLRAMLSIRDAFGTKIGYSDHTSGIEISIAAVALGATVIEKHFTLDKNLPGPDHKASLDPGELTRLIESIRNVELSLGDGIKRPSKSEVKNIPIVRKSIIALRDIRAGEIFSEENCTVKRPAEGISPMRWNDVMGRTANKAFKMDDIIEI